MKKLPKGKRYTLSRPYRQLAYQLNKAYDEMQQYRINTNATRTYAHMLEQFYEKHDLKVANPHHITLQKEMSYEQTQELGELVDMFANMAIESDMFLVEDIQKKVSPEDWQALQNKVAKYDWDAIETQISNQKFGVSLETGGDVDYASTEVMNQVSKWEVFEWDKYEKIKEMYHLGGVQDYINFLDDMDAMRTNNLLMEILSSDQYAEIISHPASRDYSAEYINNKIIQEYSKHGTVGKDLYKTIIRQIKKGKSSK